MTCRRLFTVLAVSAHLGACDQSGYVLEETEISYHMRRRAGADTFSFEVRVRPEGVSCTPLEYRRIVVGLNETTVEALPEAVEDKPCFAGESYVAHLQNTASNMIIDVTFCDMFRDHATLTDHVGASAMFVL